MQRSRVGALFLIACGTAAHPVPEAPPAAYQTRWGGLYVRQGDRIVDAPADDQALARTYPTWKAKGAASNGVALTVMTAKTSYGVGEEVRVVHVLDVSTPGRRVFIMGPKVPADEVVDGTRVTPEPEIREYPWVATYDGVTLPSPAIDDNYEITSYRFATPGTHTIEWRLGGLRSNVIELHIH